ncbi:unnamed protein product [Spodoptera littoralis]|uniref:Uncharacterized protein n=1 Tax=Spodoptera littoralis TaxID=7109 RepID=A0A9P0IB08_SPOLI|nr:unnamed protein product [Spodoptera littoralis]CAH1643420.1 unnamed protein product [Spodoptera littoralis]
MGENTDDNKIENRDQDENFEFKYNFLNLPWDDRSNKSKIGIVILLIAIFVATMALVVNSFIMHYRGFKQIKKYSNLKELSCYRVKMDDYRFVARIHSVSTQQLLCLGAVVSKSSVLANGVCVKSGPIRIYLGSMSNPRCKKGFSIDLFESMYHVGVFSKKLVLLSSYESIQGCSETIKIGNNLDWTQKVHIIGRPHSVGRTFSRQHASLARKEYVDTNSNQHLKSNYTICVKDLAACPIRAGDLMLQNGKLFGLASTSVQRFGVACFGDLSVVSRELKEMDADIVIG